MRMNAGKRNRGLEVPNDHPNDQDFAEIDKTIAEGGIAVFCEIKVPPFAAQSELVELKIVLPATWSSELLERIEACIDQFSEEKGAGKSKVVDEGRLS